MTCLMNYLINDEAVYRTAPATPGLLKRNTTCAQTILLDEEKKPHWVLHSKSL